MTESVWSAADLARSADLRDVVFREVSAIRSDDANDAGQEIQVLIRHEPIEGCSEIGIRCIARVQGGGGSYVADVEAVFGFGEQVVTADDGLREFVERVGVMVVYPYLRASVFDGAGRLGLERPLMKLMKPGAKLQPQSQG